MSNGESIKDRLSRGEKMSDILAQQDKAQAELDRKKANRPQRIDERVDLDQADKEARERKKNHPTSGSKRSIPDRWGPQHKPDTPDR